MVAPVFYLVLMVVGRMSDRNYMKLESSLFFVDEALRLKRRRALELAADARRKSPDCTI